MHQVKASSSTLQLELCRSNNLLLKTACSPGTGGCRCAASAPGQPARASAASAAAARQFPAPPAPWPSPLPPPPASAGTADQKQPSAAGAAISCSVMCKVSAHAAAALPTPEPHRHMRSGACFHCCLQHQWRNQAKQASAATAGGCRAVLLLWDLECFQRPVDWNNVICRALTHRLATSFGHLSSSCAFAAPSFLRPADTQNQPT